MLNSRLIVHAERKNVSPPAETARGSTRADGRPVEVGVLLFDRFSNHCLANTVEPLRAANSFLERAAYAWRILTQDGRPAVSSSGLTIAPDGDLASDPGGDILCVMPGYGVRALATEACSRDLRRAAMRYRTLAGLDTGSWLLAAAGLLHGRSATIHFDAFDVFAERFPEVDARRERWVIDGDRMSAGGAVASFELVRQLIAMEHGAALTVEVSSLFLQRDVGDRAPASGGPSKRASGRGGDRRVAAAVEAMSSNIEAPLPIAALARRAGCSQRDLEARFLRALGATPQTVYRRLRLNHGRRLIEDSEMSVAEIALRSGYQDASAFTRAFRKHFGRTPRALRS